MRVDGFADLRTADAGGATAVGRDTFLLHLGDSLRALGSDTEAVTAEACRLLGEHLGVAQVGFAKVLPDGERVVVDRDWNDGRIPSVVGTWRMDDFGPAFIADLRRGKTAAIPDITRDPRTSAPEVAAAYAAIRIRAILNVPLHRAGRMVALLFTHHPEPRPWSPAEISLVEETVERVWLAVLRARAEAELHHSEEIRRLALDAAGIGTFVWDVSADIAEADTRARHLLSFGPDEPVTWATALGCLIHPDDRDQLAAALRRATDPTGDGYLANDVRILLPEERARWVAIAGRTVFEGTPPRAMRMVGTVLDITERKQAEERLRESEARLRTLSDAVPAMVWSYDNDGNNLSMNARWFEFTGQKPEEVRGAGWTACTHPEDLVGILPLWERCRREGGVYEGEVRYRRADGVWRWHAFRGLPLRDAEGRIAAWYGCSIDIHDLRTAERSLRDSEARLRLATEGAGVGTWENDLVEGKGFWSPEGIALLGVDWAPFDGSGWLEAIHPNDRAGLLEAWQRTLDQDVTYEVEFRAAAPHPDGGERWLFSRGRVERDPRTGKPLRGAGVLLDITERKRVERHRELLLHELNHRVKNTLATVQSIAAQNLRTGCEPAVRQAFQGRLFALASAHDLLTAGNWEGATLGDVALHALRPHMADGQAGRIRVAGPEIRLNPRAALAFSMVVHELATNAGKYGALSTTAGRVDLTWHVSGDELRFAWRETGGPPVQAPQRRGFGSRMIEGGLAHEVGGTIVLDFARDGVVCEMAVPLARATVCAQG